MLSNCDLVSNVSPLLIFCRYQMKCKSVSNVSPRYIATAIDQAVRLANSEPVAPIPPFTGTLILRESVAAGPFFQRPA